jgi:hypothetical protein
MQKQNPRDRPASYDAPFEELSAIKMELGGERAEEPKRA